MDKHFHLVCDFPACCFPVCDFLVCFLSKTFLHVTLLPAFWPFCTKYLSKEVGGVVGSLAGILVKRDRRGKRLDFLVFDFLVFDFLVFDFLVSPQCSHQKQEVKI